MKILATLPSGMLNLSVHEMMEAAQLFGKKNIPSNFTLDIDLAPFWEVENPPYDIIHIHWVEALFDWQEVDQTAITKLEKRLQTLRKQGKKIVITRHNAIPHRKAKFDALLYQKSFEYAHAIFHMEKFSHTEYLDYYSRYDWAKNQAHYFAPIIQFTQLPNQISPQAARQKLKIPKEKFVFMVLGSIRNTAEKNLLESIAQQLTNPKDMLFVAQWPFFGSRPIWKQYKQLQYKLKYPKHRFQAAQPIDDQEMQIYLKAADVLISPRMDSLNSGLISLGFSFGKTVLGPSVGNMKDILTKTKNPMYNPLDLHTLGQSLQEAKTVTAQNKGDENLAFAQKEWSWQQVGKQHIEAYQKILEHEQ